MHPNHIDWLTGAYNRLALDAALQEALASREVVLMLADVDSLSLMNHALGHVRVDEHIRDVARLIEREGMADVYRIGGDEFVLLFENVEEATRAADAICAASCIAFAHLGSIVHGVNEAAGLPNYEGSVGTLSIGVVRGDAPTQLWERVGEALGAAKAGGRCRVVVHPSCSAQHQ